jgi:hypothetical protein
MCKDQVALFTPRDSQVESDAVPNDGFKKQWRCASHASCPTRQVHLQQPFPSATHSFRLNNVRTCAPPVDAHITFEQRHWTFVNTLLK